MLEKKCIYLALGVIFAPPVELLDIFAKSLEVRNNELVSKSPRDQHDVWWDHPKILIENENL